MTVPTAIDFQRQHRWEAVRVRCHQLALQARDRLLALSRMAPLSGEDAFSQMVAVPVPECDAAALKAALYNRFRIEVPVTSHAGQNFVRVSLQAYNSISDVDALVRAVGELLDDRSSPFRPAR